MASVLEKFTLVELITTRTESVATFVGSTNGIKFNAQTYEDLGYPAYVQLFVSDKEKQFAIKVCKEDAPNAVKFSKPKGEQRYPIKVTCVQAVAVVRKLMDWATDETWNAPGAIFREEGVIIYSLAQAYKPAAKKTKTEDATADN